jgi:ribonuclease BN (tRNA processing enzyme)
MRVVLLGTGTPVPSLKRASSSYLVEIGSDCILFDHGPGAYHRLLESGVSVTRVSHVAFTHLHYDHCLDYARLLLTRWDQGAGQIPELKVFGPAHTARMTELLVSRNGVFGPDIEARIHHGGSIQTYVSRGGVLPRQPPAPDVTELASGADVETPRWRLSAIAVPHVQPYLDSFGYRLDTKEGSLFYSGDAGPSKAVARAAVGVDVLIHMCHYISGTVDNADWKRGSAGHLEVAQIASEARVRNLVLTHISEQMDVPGVRERLIREMGAVFSGNIFWGEDLMEIPVGDPVPRPHTG